MSKETTEIKNKFAIVEVGGTQLRISDDGLYEINKIPGAKGDNFSTDKVLLIADGDTVHVGKPYVEGATVEFTIDSQKKGKKIDIFKYKAKARYRRSYGSRPLVSRLEVKKIKVSK